MIYRLNNRLVDDNLKHYTNPMTTTQTDRDRVQWPEFSSAHRPWTRWRWMGSAVEHVGLTYLLSRYAAAGIGGVEITPIYSVQGNEQSEIPYLSPRWLEMLAFTVSQAHRLDICRPAQDGPLVLPRSRIKAPSTSSF